MFNILLLLFISVILNIKFYYIRKKYNHQDF